MYKISETALRQYRNGAKNNANLSRDILTIKINCLIMSVDISNIRYTTCGKIFQFSNCQFEIDRDMNVRKISWCNGSHLLKSETINLKKNYSKYGLNSTGTNYKKITLRGDTDDRRKKGRK